MPTLVTLANDPSREFVVKVAVSVAQMTVILPDAESLDSRPELRKPVIACFAADGVYGGTALRIVHRGAYPESDSRHVSIPSALASADHFIAINPRTLRPALQAELERTVRSLMQADLRIDVV